jgi:hypothetical protein
MLTTVHFRIIYLYVCSLQIKKLKIYLFFVWV